MTLSEDEGPREDTSLEKLGEAQADLPRGRHASPPATPPLSTTAPPASSSPPRRPPRSSAGSRSPGSSRSASPASTRHTWGSARSRPREGARRGRARARRDRPDRAERGLRLAGPGLRGRARHRRGAAQRQRRRDRARPSPRLLGRPADDHAGLGDAPPRRPLRDGHPLRRRRPGRRHDRRSDERKR